MAEFSMSKSGVILKSINFFQIKKEKLFKIKKKSSENNLNTFKILVLQATHHSIFWTKLGSFPKVVDYAKSLVHLKRKNESISKVGGNIEIHGCKFKITFLFILLS
ncbi:hypothetical protein [Chryseobacterium sp. PMSZPI]|uniref:hypothetical protein n=1 Tax=Chryseobacterium sp. PMSZPI TaxID=1033900 RepID=UPI000C345497|nr:hypothetical protein [Chryseobacterium sp. PMSZPI]PKF76076.1 hypothetical protein CW752_00375 [Chryseobacterium sp. PMSZPI]